MKTCSNTGAALNALMHRACDVSLSSLDTRTPGLIYEKLMDDPLVLACPLDMDVPEEITPRQMTRLPFIAREKMSYTSIQIQTALAKHGIDADSLNVRMTVYDNAVAMQAIEMGDGCGFVPRSAVANNRMRRQSVKLVKVKNLDINRSVYLVRREDAPFEGSLKLFWGYALTGKWYENLFTYDPTIAPCRIMKGKRRRGGISSPAALLAGGIGLP
jgi:DNA-binding transcriptional LysR family regulator